MNSNFLFLYEYHLCVVESRIKRNNTCGLFSTPTKNEKKKVWLDWQCRNR